VFKLEEGWLTVALLCAMVTVVSARQEQVKDGTDTSVSLQITDMDLAASVAGTDAAKVLFGKE